MRGRVQQSFKVICSLFVMKIVQRNPAGQTLQNVLIGVIHCSKKAHFVHEIVDPRFCLSLSSTTAETKTWRACASGSTFMKRQYNYIYKVVLYPPLFLLLWPLCYLLLSRFELNIHLTAVRGVGLISCFPLLQSKRDMQLFRYIHGTHLRSHDSFRTDLCERGNVGVWRAWSLKAYLLGRRNGVEVGLIALCGRHKVKKTVKEQ